MTLTPTPTMIVHGRLATLAAAFALLALYQTPCNPRRINPNLQGSQIAGPRGTAWDTNRRGTLHGRPKGSTAPNPCRAVAHSHARHNAYAAHCAVYLTRR